MYTEKITIRYYVGDELILEKYTSLIPREGEYLIVNGIHYSIGNIIWSEWDVKVYCGRTAASASLDER